MLISAAWGEADVSIAAWRAAYAVRNIVQDVEASCRHFVHLAVAHGLRLFESVFAGSGPFFPGHDAQTKVGKTKSGERG